MVGVKDKEEEIAGRWDKEEEIIGGQDKEEEIADRQASTYGAKLSSQSVE